MLLLILLLFIAPALIVYVVFNKREKKYKQDLEKYSAIINLEEEIKSQEDILETLSKNLSDQKEILNNLNSEISVLHNTKEDISNEIQKNKDELFLLQKDIKFEKDLVEDYGFESYVFEFEDSKKYKDAIKSEKDKQKQLIKQDRACKTLFKLKFNDSASEGEKAQKRAKKMLIRTFNGEVDNVIKKVTFRNIDSSKKKIDKSFKSLNKLNDKSNGIQISERYLDSKLKELDLAYGKKIKEQEEKEIAKEEKELLREQKRAEKEIQQELKRQEKERKKKEKEIALKEKIIKQITEELGLESDAAKKAKAEIEKLKNELQEVLGREQSISQAEITTAGYVYIISNIGSFGEDVYKIGLTRRLEPEQRVNELSSASVPFKYNCHGMIWSLDAVELEKKLHEEFDRYRVNKVNKRKEFFRVPFSKIKEAIYKIDPEIELIEDVEAEEYYQTLAIERRMLEQEEFLQEESIV